LIVYDENSVRQIGNRWAAWILLYNSATIRMKASIFGLCLLSLIVLPAVAQQNQTATSYTDVEQEVLELSRNKWIWMAEQKADTLAALFDDRAKFVHMGGTWGKEQEVEIIRSGGIHYKQADVHEVMVEVVDDVAIVWNRITLLAVVGGNEVTNPFMVTEVYKKLDGRWKMLALTFSLLRVPGR